MTENDDEIKKAVEEFIQLYLVLEWSQYRSITYKIYKYRRTED